MIFATLYKQNTQDWPSQTAKHKNLIFLQELPGIPDVKVCIFYPLHKNYPIAIRNYSYRRFKKILTNLIQSKDFYRYFAESLKHIFYRYFADMRNPSKSFLRIFKDFKVVCEP